MSSCGSYKISADRTSCIGNCETGKAVDINEEKCVAECGLGEYFDASDVANTDNFLQKFMHSSRHLL